jgi:hypothetical protein
MSSAADIPKERWELVFKLPAMNDAELLRFQGILDVFNMQLNEESSAYKAMLKFFRDELRINNPHVPFLIQRTKP